MLAQPIQRRHIVLVEDDAVLATRVSTALAHSFSDVDVTRSRDIAEALRLLQDERTGLLIVDAQAQSLDGVALATEARTHRPTLAVIAIGTPQGSAWRRQVAALGAVAWLPKPPRMDQLVGLVGRVLVVPLGFTGELDIGGLPELVQLLCMANVSGALHVEHGDERGSIWFERGAIVDALAGGARGTRSFQRMLAWEGGVFAFDRNAHAAMRSIEVPAMQLLLEGVRALDESYGVGDPEAFEREGRGSQVRLRVVADPRAEPETALESARLFGAEPRNWTSPQQRAADRAQRGMELAQQKRYAEALLEWEQAAALDPQNRTIAANLRRLRSLTRNSDNA